MWLSLLFAPALAADGWENTLDRVSDAVVSIRMLAPVAFDGATRNAPQATGFVIDAERGLILTNRHVVSPGPMVAQALFVNQEEVELQAIYRDPVHDFGIFRYDPDELLHHAPVSLTLDPAGAQVGTEIRVVGNDAGQTMSILDGTLARIDRSAPRYGWGFNDFNTFYLQASSNTTGGSSGSPVVNERGHVVGLNAGSNRSSSTAYYLPLDRVVRAVELIQEGKPVPRGTLETTWTYITFDELSRQGLSAETERRAREDRPEGKGLLSVQSLVTAGVGDRAGLRVGDVLLAINGTRIYDFVSIEAILDDGVGSTVELTIERSGEARSVKMSVQDLHAISPAEVLQLGLGTLHTISYQHARLVPQTPRLGVYVAEPAYGITGGVPRHAVIFEANGTPVEDLDDLVEVLADIPDDEVFTLRWYGRDHAKDPRSSSVRMERDWSGMRRCTRAEDGSWPCVEIPPPERVAASQELAPIPWAPAADKRADAGQRKIVDIITRVPFQVAGYPSTYVGGLGLIVDLERGLVVCDRWAVPGALTDVRLRIADAVEIPAEVVALHPTNNLALVRFDPQAGATLGLEAFELMPDNPEVGDALYAMQPGRGGQAASTQVKVDNYKLLSLTMGGAPRFRSMNLESIRVELDGSRALVDKKGRLAAFHTIFSYWSKDKNRTLRTGIPVSAIHDLLALAEGQTDERLVGWELTQLDLVEAERRGLPAESVAAAIAHDPERRRALMIRRLAVGEPGSDELRTGDLLTRIDGQLVSRVDAVDALLRGKEQVEVELYRDGEQRSVQVSTTVPRPIDVDRVVRWAGLRIHAPHRAVRFYGVASDEPYIAWYDGGSPAARAGVFARQQIVSVDDVPTPDLDALIAAVSSASTGDYVKLRTRTHKGQERVFSVRVDLDYWPTEELVRADGRWARRPI